MTRDYCGEVAGIIEKATADGDYSAPVLASEIVSDLRDRDPELLAGWLDAQADQFMREAIGAFDRSRRTHASATRRMKRFGQAAAAHEGGDSEALTPFLDMPFVLADGSRRQLRKMTGPECGFVAGTYEARAAHNRMWAVFFRALEKKLAGRAVDDVYSEEQVAAMFHRGRPAA